MSEIPATLGRYRVEEELGRGAMGRVFRAYDPTLERTVAIKTLNPDLPEDIVAEMKARFVREAKSAGRLNHPNIVTIYDVDVAGEVAYIAMEYLEGRSLLQMLEAGERLSFDLIADIVAQVAEALDYAGRFGIVHRDVKPANIMVSPDGLAKLTDFGLAYVPSSQMTQKGTILGSPKYMSPEQVSEQALDGRADLFSLGGVLFELLTGKTPFELPGITLFQLMERIVKQPAASPREVNAAVPEAFVEIVARALAKSPDERFPRGREFAEALRGVRAGAASAVFADEPSLQADEPLVRDAAKILNDLEASSRIEAPARAGEPETLSTSLRQGFHYFETLVQRVIEADPAFTIHLDLAHAGSLPAAELSGGLVECHTRALEGREVVDRVTLNYRMQSPHKARAALHGAEARQLKKQLERAGLVFDRREIKDAAGETQVEAFLIDVDLTASATIKGDYESQCVEIECQNVGLPGPAKYRLEREEFDELVWDFGKLMLGFPSAFAGKRLPDLISP